MTANCRRCHGLGSTLAPASRRIVNFLRFGSTAAIAGRSTPRSTPITNIEIAIAAPPFPAPTHAAPPPPPPRPAPPPPAAPPPPPPPPARPAPPPPTPPPPPAP